jgi:hypothetical protein
LGLRVYWLPGEKAAQHDVYLGADQAAVANATMASIGIYRGRSAIGGPAGWFWLLNRDKKVKASLIFFLTIERLVWYKQSIQQSRTLL